MSPTVTVLVTQSGLNGHNGPDVEMQQSAEILSRELRARGISLANLGGNVTLELNPQLLARGEVSLTLSQTSRQLTVPLEDAVDKTVELISELKR